MVLIDVADKPGIESVSFSSTQSLSRRSNRLSHEMCFTSIRTHMQTDLHITRYENINNMRNVIFCIFKHNIVNIIKIPYEKSIYVKLC